MRFICGIKKFNWWNEYPFGVNITLYNTYWTFEISVPWIMFYIGWTEYVEPKE